jgi:hypothetical protein
VNHDYTKPDSNGADILIEAHNLITGPRQQAYSHPFDDYWKVTQLFHNMTGIQLSIKQAITFMICVKLARIATNDQHGRWHRDSVVDAAGYLGCLSMVHEHIQQKREDAVTRFKENS